MQPTDSTLPENTRTRAVELLNRRLAAAIDPPSQLRQARWNVRGPNFTAISRGADRQLSRVESYVAPK